VPHDGIKAAYYYELAAKEGNPLANFVLARLYANGAPNLSVNPKKAIGYYELAARSGNGRAAIELVRILQKKDASALANWYRINYHADVTLKAYPEKKANSILLVALCDAAAQKGEKGAAERFLRLSSRLTAREKSKARQIATLYSGN